MGKRITASRTAENSTKSSLEAKRSLFLRVFNSHPHFIALISAFIVVRALISIYYRQVWWDSAIYLGMAKYLYSAGSVGLWEPLRPVFLSALLGIFWKSGFDVLVSGRIIAALFGLGCLILTYLVGKEVFDRRTAIIATFFMAFSSTFLFFGGMVLTGVPSLFFALAAIYFFLKKRYYISGILFSLSFITRFPQGIMVVLSALVLTLFLYKRKIKFHDYLKRLVLLGVGFLTVSIPFLIFNKVMYNNPLYSFIEGARIISHTNLTMRTDTFYYFYRIVIENIFSIFSVLGIHLLIKKRKLSGWIFALPLIFFFIYFNFQGHREMRYLIILLPYIYLLSAYWLVEAMSKARTRKRIITVIVFMTLASSVIGLLLYMEGYDYGSARKLESLYNSLGGKQGGILLSSPAPVAYLDFKPEIVYWGNEDVQLYDYYFVDKHMNYAIISPQEFFCQKDDLDCMELRLSSLTGFNNNEQLVSHEVIGNSDYFIYERKERAGISDPYSGNIDFSFVIDNSGFDKQQYSRNVSLLMSSSNLSFFALGDIYLILGRLTQNKSMICKSADFYNQYAPTDKEEEALVYETLASLGCDESRNQNLLRAAEIWDELGNDFRADLYRNMAAELPTDFAYHFLEHPPTTKKQAGQSAHSSVIIGNSSLVLDKRDVVLSQVDRVTRDWLSYQIYEPKSPNLLSIFSERLTYNESELMPDIGWHEGGRIMQMNKVGFEHVLATGTLVKRRKGIWYAPNEEGLFMFRVPSDKVYYPTTRFLREDVAVVVDTHGMNMLVEQAIRQNATAVIACCDHPGKIKAAEYLYLHGITPICFTDRFAYLTIGNKSDIMASAPFEFKGGRVVIGNRPIQINRGESIVVLNATGNAQMYYDTPSRYFTELSMYIDLDIHLVTITENDISRLIESADELDADFIGVRVFSSEDYNLVKVWLEENKKNKAVLFHSMPYPYGYNLFEEFPEQTTFGDVQPIFLD